MCGRFALWAQRLEDDINALYPFLALRNYEPPAEEGGQENQPEFYPRYNIAPRSMSPVIRRVEVDAHPGAVLQLMKWGVIPHWQKHESNNLATINARSEALLDNEPGMWAALKGKKRCIVPVSGYFEWLKKGNQRIPYYTKHKGGRPLLFAGMWESTTLEGDKYPTYTFTIVTTSSSSQLSFIHDRMPVVLDSEDDIKLWLDPEVGWSREVAQLLKPYEKPLETYAVPKEVGKVGTNDPSFVQPVAERKDGIAAMFKKQEASKSKGSPSGTPSASQDTNLASPPEYSPIASGSQTKVSESEKMTLGDARKAQKRAKEEDEEVVELGNNGNERNERKDDEQPPVKKAKRAPTSPQLSPNKRAASMKKGGPSPKKKFQEATPQKGKITDFFKK